MNNAIIQQPVFSLPPITYKGKPVVTTEMLAQAYECPAKNIRMNFANNRERFIEGRHFFALANGDLADFHLQAKSFGSQIPLSPKARSLTLWLERGAARHAKMLNTDRAWDVFEMLEETFFRVVRAEPETEQAALPETTTPSTPADRKPLRSLVNAWAQIARAHHSALWPQVKAHFQLERIDDLPVEWIMFARAFVDERLERIDDLPVEWIPDALAFVQGKIDGMQKALPEPEKPKQPALPMESNVILPPATAEYLIDKHCEEMRRGMRDIHHAYRGLRAIVNNCTKAVQFEKGVFVGNFTQRAVNGESFLFGDIQSAPGQHALAESGETSCDGAGNSADPARCGTEKRACRHAASHEPGRDLCAL